MEVVASLTIWAMFSCFLLFPRLGFSPVMHRTAMTLLAGELLALATWSYGSEGCVERPCAPAAEAARSVAAVDVPLLAAGLVVFALWRGMRRRRHVGDTARL